MLKEDLDDNEYGEASNTLLNAWITIVSHSDDFPPDMFKKHCVMVVESYLKSHLGAPDGIRVNTASFFLSTVCGFLITKNILIAM